MKPTNTDIEQLLQGFTPQPLAASRDELLFQAGYAAGNRRQVVPWFWRLAAAVLLVACLGMSLALQQQAIELHDAQVALASIKADRPTDSRQPEQSLPATNNSGSPLPAAGRGAGGEGLAPFETAQPDRPSSLRDFELNVWQQLARSDLPTHGRLTARGWIEGAEPPYVETDEPEPSASPSPRREPQSYLELRQLHLEG